MHFGTKNILKSNRNYTSKHVKKIKESESQISEHNLVIIYYY
jgi:hypothetical protein